MNTEPPPGEFEYFLCTQRLGLRTWMEADPELGFHLRRDYWGQELAVEAARAVIEYALVRLDAAGLFAGHHPANELSRRVLIKLVFRYAHDEFYLPTGPNHPSYRLTAEAYAERMKAQLKGGSRWV